MTNRRRPIILFGLMLMLLLVVVFWTAMTMQAERDAAARAAAGLEEARLIASRAASLRTRDLIAQSVSESAVQDQAMAQQIASAAARAGLSGDWQRGIEPERAVRVGDTPYLQKPTVLYAQQLTLDELATLLYELTYDSPLSVSELTLKTPPGADPGRQWNADVTLTYLIYQPPTRTRGGG